MLTTALQGQELSCTCLAHYELESIFLTCTDTTTLIVNISIPCAAWPCMYSTTCTLEELRYCPSYSAACDIHRFTSFLSPCTPPPLGPLFVLPGP